VPRLGSHDGCQPRILDDFRLDLTADVRVRHGIGHFRRSDEATGLVVAHADPVGAFANTEALCDESSQRVHQSPRGLLARLDGTLASASGAADSGPPRPGIPKRLADLDNREERLIDLAEQGLPQHKIRQRLTQLYADRARLNEELAETGAQLAVGAERLMAAMELLRDIAGLYANAVDEVRGQLNAAIFSRLYVEEDGVSADRLRDPFDDIAAAERSWELTRAVGEEQRRRTYERAPARAGAQLCP
jgi:hypothetical protein